MRQILLFFLMISISAFAGEVGFDSSFLDQLPTRRAQAIVKSKSTADDSTSAINAKREAYYSVLKQMIQGVRSRYYFHTEFPKDLCAALEQHAVVLTGIDYPLSNATGSSGYDALLTKTKIRLAEEMICHMSQVIYEEAYRDGKTGKVTKRSADVYRGWLSKWNGPA